MAKQKKLFWLKLKDDFYDREEIKIIEDMDNGTDYINFYLKLLLKSVKTEGRLYFRDTIPYSPKMLASITGTNIDTVKVGVDLFLGLGLMEKWDDGTLFMVETQNMIGSETKWAKIKREQREKEKENLEIGQCPKLSNKSPIETDTKTDTEKEIEIETHTDIEIDQNPLLEKWLDEYSSGKNNPPAYKADMRKKILNKNPDAIQAFFRWKKEYRERLQKVENDKKIKTFDYHSLIGFELGKNKMIERVVDYEPNSSMIHVYFSDGTNDPSVLKEDLFSWYQLKLEETA